MKKPTAEEITAILLRWSKGDEHALDSLTPLVYDDLRRLARYLLKGERPEHTLQPTALVNEAYLKLAGRSKLLWKDRAHFFAIAARVMRRLLVDSARSRRRAKRGRGVTHLSLDEGLAYVPEQSNEILELDTALTAFAAGYPRQARVVELRFFGGLSNQELAGILGISANTVIRDWDFAKAWLRREMKGRRSNDKN